MASSLPVVVSPNITASVKYADQSGQCALDPLPWFSPLRALIRRLVDDTTSQHIKLMGICLGHQLIAQALGGITGPASRYEIGEYQLDLNAEGSVWWTQGRRAQLVSRSPEQAELDVS